MCSCVASNGAMVWNNVFYRMERGKPYPYNVHIMQPISPIKN